MSLVPAPFLSAPADNFAVLPSERAQYSAIIDGILASSDLNTISAKSIRKGLAAKLDIDITDKKVARFSAHQARLEALILL